MFKGSLIPGILNLSGILDRTLYVFRRHYYAYLMINLVTFGPLFLLATYLIASGTLDLALMFDDLVNYIGWIVIYTLFFLTLPAMLADLSMQEYTAALVRELPISWDNAIKKAITPLIFHYFLTRLVGFVAFALGAGLSIVLVFIPLVGQFISGYVRVTTYAFVVGLAPAIMVEERTNALQTLKRNIQLASKELMLYANTTFVGYYICLGLIASSFLLVLGVFGLIAALIFSKQTLFTPDASAPENFLKYFVLYAIPLIGVVLFMPLQSIFTSIMYYNLRSRSSAFHLENRLNIRLREINAQA